MKFLALLLIIFSASAKDIVIQASRVEGIPHPTEYVSNPNATYNTIGWADYNDSAAAPVDCTGGTISGNLTWTRNANVSAANGVSEYLLSNTGANTQGSGKAYFFYVKPKDKGKNLLFSFWTRLASGTYTDLDYKLYAYDVTNSGLLNGGNYLQVKCDNNQNNQSGISAVSGLQRCSAIIPLGSSTASVRACIHNSATTAVASAVGIGEVSIQSDWQNKTKIQDTQAIKYSGWGGRGSTNTAIPYFSTEDKNEGTKILTVSNSSIYGMSLTATRDCQVVGQWSFVGAANAAAYENVIGWSLNSTQLTGTVISINASSRYGVSGAGTGSSSAYRLGWSSPISISLKEGDILRPHDTKLGSALYTGLEITATAISDGYNFPGQAKIQVMQIAQYQNAMTKITSGGMGWNLSTAYSAGDLKNYIGDIDNSANYGATSGQSFYAYNDGSGITTLKMLASGSLDISVSAESVTSSAQSIKVFINGALAKATWYTGTTATAGYGSWTIGTYKVSANDLVTFYNSGALNNSSSNVSWFTAKFTPSKWEGMFADRNPLSFSFSFGTTNATTVCSASPCSYLDQIGSYVTSVTRSGTGIYVANFSKTYSSLKCTAGFGGTVADIGKLYTADLSCKSCNSLTISTARASTGAASDSFGTLTCQAVE